MKKPFFLALALVGIITVSYFALAVIYNPLLERRVNYYNNELGVISEFSLEEQKRFADFYAQLSALDNALDNEQRVSPLLAFLTTTIHSSVVVERFDFDAETRTLALEGRAKDEEVFTIQLNALRRARHVADVMMHRAAQEEKGVGFHITITFDEAFFK